jgi:hypothetical protein
LRYKTREALDTLSNSEESDKAAIERLSREDKEIQYDQDKVEKAWNASQIYDADMNAVPFPGDMFVAVSELKKVWDTSAGESMLADSSEVLLGRKDGTIDDVVGAMVVAPKEITREEIIEKAAKKKLQAMEDAEERAKSAEKSLKDAEERAKSAEKSLKDAEENASQSVKNAEEEVSRVTEELGNTKVRLQEMGRYRGQVAALQLKIKELEAALAQAQKASEAQTQKPTEEVKETQENVDDDIPVVKFTNEAQAKKTVKVQEQPQKPDAPRGVKYK